MRTGRPKRPLTLTEDEHERLQALAHRARSQPALARRARVVLACAQGLANQSVAKKLRCSLGMIAKWRSRFLRSRLEGRSSGSGVRCDSEALAEVKRPRVKRCRPLSRVQIHPPPDFLAGYAAPSQSEGRWGKY